MIVIVVVNGHHKGVLELLFIYRCSSNGPTLSIYHTQVFNNAVPLLDNKPMVLY